ncbi:transposase [Flavobacterium sp. CS20]|nr:transposase [Flavobacterium sp. CS20]
MTVIPKREKPELTDYQKRKQIEEYNERNQIEGKFGQVKQAYGLKKKLKS